MDKDNYQLEAYSDYDNWPHGAAKDLGWILGLLFPPEINSQTTFKFDLNLPTLQDAKSALEGNRSMNGKIGITWFKKPDEPLELKLPLPFHNVFLRHSGNDKRALPYIWNPYLGETPGFRLIKKYSKTKKEKAWWRLGLMHGNYIEGICDAESSKSKKGKIEADKKPPGRTQFLATPEHYPDNIKDMFKSTLVEVCAVTNKKLKTRSSLDSVKEQLGKITQVICKENPVDEDDLSHKLLINFPFWLRGRICKRILEEIFVDESGDKLNEDAISTLNGERVTTEDIQNRVWNCLLEKGERISQTLVPFDNLTKEGRMVYIAPENPVDMAALLTSFQRYYFKSDIREKLPPVYRQNHPSFKGNICPVQSPESEDVGLALHLSRSTFKNMNSEGVLKHEIGSPDDELGFGAGLIPFYHHNDGARNMMGAKNLRQALPLSNRTRPIISTGGEEEVIKAVKPLIDAGICPDASDKEGNLALGKDLLVAYLPWEGFNFEDAIVVGSQGVERGDLMAVKKERFREEIKTGWIPSPSGGLIPFDGMAKEGSALFSGCRIAFFALEGAPDSRPYDVIYKDQYPATLKEISFNRKSPWTSGVLEYYLEKEFPLRVGDKLMGRHGNKGVIGAIIPKEKMPRLPDDASIPEKFRGRPIDVLLNPHGVISRMNVGQLLETHIGWLLHCGTKPDELLLPEFKAKEKHVGRAFFNGIDHNKIQELFVQHGLDKYGRVKLQLPDGGETKSPVVVGFQHIVRLRKRVDLKVKTRKGGVNARYSAATGQAVHGRKLGGGQRVGEMEIWALSAYSAHTIIEEMLGIKSDAVLINALSAEENVGDKSSFLARFKDMLLALLINVEYNDKGIGFSFLSPADVLKKIGNERAITNDGFFEKKLSAVFVCQQGGKKCCTFKLLDGKRIPVLPTKRTVGKALTIRLEDLLEYVGYRRDGTLTNEEGDFTQKLIHINDNKADGALSVSFDKVEGDQLKASVTPHKQNPPKHWPKTLSEVYLYGRFQKEKKVNYLASELINELKKDNGEYDIGDLQITCPKHKTSNIKGIPPFIDKYSFDKGSMYDPGIFGSIRTVGSEKNALWGIIELPVEISYPVSVFLGKESKEESPVRIKYIPVLPLRYRLPVKKSEGYDEDELTKKCYLPILQICAQYTDSSDFYVGEFVLPLTIEKLCEVINNNNYDITLQATINTIDWLNEFLAVPNFYDILVQKKSESRLSEHIKRLVEKTQDYRNKSFSDLNNDEQGNVKRLNRLLLEETYPQETPKCQYEKKLTYTVKRLLKTLAEKLKGKEGIIRRDGLGRRVDCSARMVIVPDPDLRWDQAGVPTPVLVELLRDELIAWAKDELNYGELVNKIIAAIELIGKPEELILLNKSEKIDIKAAFEFLQSWTWEKGEKGKRVLELFYNLLVKFRDANKDLVVILNRQPSLHRDSMQSFYPVPLAPDKNNVLHLCPLVCKGFGADFDGDEMALHVPISSEAREEAKMLLPTRNMLSLATGNPLANFDQDFVLGTYWLGHESSGMRNEFLSIFSNNCCKDMIPREGMKKKEAGELLKHLILKHILERKDLNPEIVWKWMNLAFKCCSQMGVSFSFYELLELSLSVQADRDKIKDEFCGLHNSLEDKIDADKLNELYQGIGKMCLEKVINTESLNTPGIHFAAMALSGARGAKQVRQLLVARGFLSPGDTPFEFEKYKERFIYHVSLTEGMPPEEAFWAAMNARSSMCDKKLGTGEAGYLTRRLVFARWPFSIKGEDCGSESEKRTPLTCLTDKGVCVKCYGVLPDGRSPEVGFPAGLIAAQSIGERGTQLSMQSFHTGQRGIDIEYVENALNGKIFNDKKNEFEECDWFSDVTKAHAFISLLKNDNVYKDIEDRHFQILWRVIHESTDKTLKSATSEIGTLSLMAFESQLKVIFEAAKSKVVALISDPVARVIANRLREKEGSLCQKQAQE